LVVAALYPEGKCKTIQTHNTDSQSSLQAIKPLVAILRFQTSIGHRVISRRRISKNDSTTSLC